MTDSIRSILRPDCTRVRVAAASKESLLRYLGELIYVHVPGSSADELLRGFLAREELGSTGIGDGVAIPHCRLARCTVTHGALVKLDAPIDFDAVDRQPVDLVFALLVPEKDAEQHLQALAMLARRFNQPTFRQALREADDQQMLYELAISRDEG
ncbi:MAG TPA: PTS sugar transporter subunit IIA [Pseudomonadales bacterium]